MITVGITGVGGGVGQAVLRALGYGNLATRVVGMDTRPMSPGLYWADSAYLVPQAVHEDKYIERLVEICARECIDVLIPGLDVELGPLSRNQSLFLDRGCKVIVSSPEGVQLCRDKLALFEFCNQRGLPFVTTYSLTEAQRQIGELTFPVIVKPRAGMGSVGVLLLHEADELLRIPPSNVQIVQSYLPSGSSETDVSSFRSTGGHPDQSNEISAQFFIGDSGEVLGSFASVNLLKDGVPWEVLPDPVSPALSEGLRVVTALAIEGVRGPVNLQGRLTCDGVLFFEANARFTGLTGVRSALGYREVEAAIQAFVKNQEQEARRCLSYLPGFVATRHVEETIVPDKRVEFVRRGQSLSADRYSNMPRRVLVTGASGYIGANLIARLLAVPEIQEVRAALRSESSATRLMSLFENSPRLKVVHGELPASPWSLEAVDMVIHLAALRSPSACAEEFFLVNSEGTRCLLEAAREAGVTGLIYLSSQAVYGTRRPPLWTEMLAAQPETPYGLSKWIGELLCLDERTDLLHTVVLRVPGVYGLGHFLRWEELPHKFASLAAQGQSLPVYAGGEQRMDMLHVRDLCDAIIKSFTLPLPRSQQLVFNVGSGQPVSVNRLAALCQTAAVEIGLPARPIELLSDAQVVPCNFGMDIRRARAHLGWAPTISLIDGLRELVAASIGQRPSRRIVHAVSPNL